MNSLYHRLSGSNLTSFKQCTNINLNLESILQVGGRLTNLATIMANLNINDWVYNQLITPRTLNQYFLEPLNQKYLISNARVKKINLSKNPCTSVYCHFIIGNNYQLSDGNKLHYFIEKQINLLDSNKNEIVSASLTTTYDTEQLNRVNSNIAFLDSLSNFVLIHAFVKDKTTLVESA